MLVHTECRAPDRAGSAAHAGCGLGAGCDGFRIVETGAIPDERVHPKILGRSGRHSIDRKGVTEMNGRAVKELREPIFRWFARLLMKRSLFTGPDERIEAGTACCTLRACVLRSTAPADDLIFAEAAPVLGRAVPWTSDTADSRPLSISGEASSVSWH